MERRKVLIFGLGTSDRATLSAPSLGHSEVEGPSSRHNFLTDVKEFRANCNIWAFAAYAPDRKWRVFVHTALDLFLDAVLVCDNLISLQIDMTATMLAEILGIGRVSDLIVCALFM
jgi:hypothetical protein